jgi:hypothetical protein
MNQLYDLYKNGATAPQRAYMDQLILSQQQVRSIDQSLLDALSSIKDNSVASQITAAVTLIRMNVSPVISIHIPFGGDNHDDPGLARETSETVSGVASLASLMQQLASAGLQDKVTFMSLNVFGRTLATNGGPSAADGRAHNAAHQVSITIGKPFKGGVIGGCSPRNDDYGATPIDSKSGAGTPSGDVSATDTLGAFGKTLLAAVGGDPSIVTLGTVIAPALA